MPKPERKCKKSEAKDERISRRRSILQRGLPNELFKLDKRRSRSKETKTMMKIKECGKTEKRN